ncbi:MAG: hypothetical protein OEZ20_07885 [candidate division WOR-3 bacterium]|nr:hypothetical protein [candidate division WOR-3 bacterium]
MLISLKGKIIMLVFNLLWAKNPIQSNTKKGGIMLGKIKTQKLALIGLIILFAVTLVMAGGGKPPEMYSQLGLTPLSPEEKQIIDNAYLQSGDRGEIAKYQRYWYKFEVHTLLKRVFPAVQFYQLNSGITVPETPYIMGYRNGKFYNLPSSFNRLLLDNNLEVNDKNIIELAKAFVVIALMDNPPIDYSQPNWEDNLDKLPEVIFLEGKRSVDKKQKPPIYWVHIETEVNKQKQEWDFRIREGLFQWGTRRNEGETSIKYYDFVIPKKEGKRGEIDLDKQIDISTDTSESNATVEFDINNNPHYYLIVKNNEEATGYKVKFELSGFQSYQPDVYILVRCINAAYADILLRQVVEINANGNGSFVWYPTSETTCITRVWALWAIDTINFDTTSSKELTLEKIRTAQFPPSSQDFSYVYYTDQFLFHAPDTLDTAYVTYTLNATLASWDSLVNKWNFDNPQDSNNIHQTFLGDRNEYYHGKLSDDATAKSATGKNRKIRIADEIPRNIWPYTYYPADKAFLSVIAHEFYHGIQFRYNDSLFWDTTWRYFTEGQAVFIKSVVCADEELKNAPRYYRKCANDYLETKLNTSLKYCSNNFCLYWRFLYEKFYPNGEIAQKLSIIRDCYKYTDSVGINPIADGSRAITRAFSNPNNPGSCTTFAQSIDSFATACYVKNFNPNNIYVKPLEKSNKVALFKKIRILSCS